MQPVLMSPISTGLNNKWFFWPGSLACFFSSDTTRTTDFLCSRVASPGLACALRQAVAAASCLDFVALLAIGARLVDGLSVASLDAILSGFIGHILV